MRHNRNPFRRGVGEGSSLKNFAEYMGRRGYEMNLRKLGIFGLISLLSYTAMVVFSPLAYPGYEWMSMAVSDLTAEGAPSLQLATRLNALFGPCAVVSIMAVCVAISGSKSKLFKLGIYSFAGMEWICSVGYTMFPWVADEPNTNPQNLCHLIVTVLVFVLSLAALRVEFYSSQMQMSENTALNIQK